jgi:hypothetical protein
MSLRLEKGGAKKVVENQFLKLCFMRGPTGANQQKRKLIQQMGQNS